MSFEKRKAMKKIVEDLERDDLVEPTHSDWAAPSLLVTKKDGTYRLVVDYRGLNKQIEKTCWPLPRINEVIDSLEETCTSQTLIFCRDTFKWRWKKRVKM